MRALLVEDDALLRAPLCEAMAQWGFSCDTAATGARALALWQANTPGVVLLDLGLPDMDGLDVLQCARALGLDAPVLLLTARVTVGDRVLGLNFGADDYLAKPCDFGELRARLCALLRRAQNTALPPMVRRLGALHWDPDATSFRLGDQPLCLTPREQALLRALVHRPNHAQGRQALLDAVFPRGNVQDEALEVVAHRLRRKLGPGGLALVHLRGLGYLLKPAASQPAVSPGRT